MANDVYFTLQKQTNKKQKNKKQNKTKQNKQTNKKTNQNKNTTAYRKTGLFQKWAVPSIEERYNILNKNASTSNTRTKTGKSLSEHKIGKS